MLSVILMGLALKVTRLSWDITMILYFLVLVLGSCCSVLTNSAVCILFGIAILFSLWYWGNDSNSSISSNSIVKTDYFCTLTIFFWVSYVYSESDYNNLLLLFAIDSSLTLFSVNTKETTFVNINTYLTIFCAAIALFNPNDYVVINNIVYNTLLVISFQNILYSLVILFDDYRFVSTSNTLKKEKVFEMTGSVLLIVVGAVNRFNMLLLTGIILFLLQHYIFYLPLRSFAQICKRRLCLT